MLNTLLLWSIFTNAFAQNPFDAFFVKVPIRFDSALRKPEKIIREQRHWLSFWIKMGSCNFNLEIESQAQCKNPNLKTGTRMEIARMIRTSNQNQYELVIDRNQIECLDSTPVQAATGNLICSPRKTEIEIQTETDSYFQWGNNNHGGERSPARAESSALINQIKKRFMPARQ